jgi:hypothetical protein
MIVINTISDTKFSFNGVNYLKNFTPIVVGSKIEILNTYDSKIKLTDFPTSFDQFEVDGNTFANVALLQDALLLVIFTRSSLSVVDTENTFTLSFPRLAISGNATNVFFASFINTSSVLFNSSTAIADHTLLTSINFGITRLFTIPQDCIIDKITCSLNVAFELSIWKADSFASPTTGKTEVFYETSSGSVIANYNVASPTLSQGNILVPMIKTLGGTTTYFGDFFITFKTI